MNAEFLRTKGSLLIHKLESLSRRTSKSLIQLAMLAGVVGYAFLGGGIDTANAQNGCAGVLETYNSVTSAQYTLDPLCQVSLKGMAGEYGFDGMDLANRLFLTGDIPNYYEVLQNTGSGQLEIKIGNEVDGTLKFTDNQGGVWFITSSDFAALLNRHALGPNVLPSEATTVGETPTDQVAVTALTYPTATPVSTAIYPAPAGVWVGENFLPDEEDQINQNQTENLPFAVSLLSMPWCWGPLVGIASFLSYQIISARNRKKQYEKEQTAAERRAVEKEEKRKQKKRSQATVDDQYYFDEHPTNEYTPPTPRVDTHVEWPAFESSHQLPEPDPGNAVATQGWAGQLVNLANSIIYASQMRDGVEVVDAEAEDVK